MKKILIGLMIGIFLIGIVIGMIGMIAGIFTSNFEMAAGGILVTLMSLVFLVALPMTLDVLEGYLKSM